MYYYFFIFFSIYRYINIPPTGSKENIMICMICRWCTFYVLYFEFVKNSIIIVKRNNTAKWEFLYAMCSAKIGT